MSEIYSNAMLNLGFAAARSPFDGFSVERTIKPQCWIELPLIFDGGVRSYILIIELSVLDVPYNFRGRNAVFARAWCLQERFLSKRMVHFCRSGLFWECDTLRLTSDVLPVSYIPMLTDEAGIVGASGLGLSTFSLSALRAQGLSGSDTTQFRV